MNRMLCDVMRLFFNLTYLLVGGCLTACFWARFWFLAMGDGGRRTDRDGGNRNRKMRTLQHYSCLTNTRERCRIGCISNAACGGQTASLCGRERPTVAHFAALFFEFCRGIFAVCA